MSRVFIGLLCASILAASTWAAPAAISPEPLDAYHGYYTGTYAPAEGDPITAEGWVIARADKDKKRFHVVRLVAGDTAKPVVEIQLRGEPAERGIVLTGEEGWSGSIDAASLVVTGPGKANFSLRRIDRQAPDAGKAPPEGAMVLLPYKAGQKTNLDAWANKNWTLLPDGSMEVGKGDQRTTADLGNVQLHVEFNCPFDVDKTGQGRGNSGVYLQDRYEVQVLDSFGLKSKDNDCGGIYKIATPKANACLLPGEWQTYDITFHAVKVDAAGKVTALPRITVKQNGVLIHDNVEIPIVTGGAKGDSHVAVAPLRLQDHGNRVRYRNIWYVPLKD